MAALELAKGSSLYFVVPKECGNGVYRIAQKVEKDVAMVTEAVCVMTDRLETIEDTPIQAVIALTKGEGKLAQELAGKYPVLRKAEGKREAYAFLFAEEPVEGVRCALIIYGSEKLGTIYGLFHLSELLGVTPSVFWGDATPAKQEYVTFTKEVNMVSKEPSVKYRGFFINDEWPCFGSWATTHFGGFTAKMYDHIFEYLLRMKGNYLWPAMWSSCFLLDGPQMKSMELADDYGIYIGMSHHEPCMRSGAEYSKVRGVHSPYGDAWSYVENRDGILRFWEDGIKRSVGHHVFVTVGMRGENDSKMLGEGSPISENVRLLKEIITKQREMIHRHLETDGKKVSQLFAVYKEVEDYYFGGESGEGLRGYEGLEDVTLLLCDDNFGNMRALPEASDRRHKGGFGMYYHLDYHGDPISYEWVASQPLTKIWEQMTQAYAYGIRELWIVNAGDVKFQEYPLQYFMELAYDFEKWGTNAVNQTQAYTKKWISDIFGSYASEEERESIRDVLDGYLRLNALRRPEALNDEVYHPAHESEADRMLDLCERLEKENDAIWETLQDRKKADAYYSLVYFPAAASFNLLKMHLYAGKNHLYAAQGKAAANWYGARMEECMEKDAFLAAEWAAFADGKWAGMELAEHIGFTNWNAEDWRYPVRHVVRLSKQPRLVVSKADETAHYTNQYFPKPLVVADFSESEVESVRLQIANGGQGVLRWEISLDKGAAGPDGTMEGVQTGNCGFLSFSRLSGRTRLEDELLLTVDKSRLPIGEEVTCGFEIRTRTEAVPVMVKACRKDRPDVPVGTFFAQNQMFVIDAAHYAEKEDVCREGGAAGFHRLSAFGKYESGMKVFPVTAAFEENKEAPSVTYQIWAKQADIYCMELHISPANPLVYGGALHLGVSVNDGAVQSVAFTDAAYKGGEPGCVRWEQAVLTQEHVGCIKVRIREGFNRITVYAREAGIVLERLVLYPQQYRKKASYLGQRESMMVKGD